MTDTTPPSVTTRACVVCGKTSRITMLTPADQVAYRSWRSGEYVQRAFAHWDDDKRELLVSGTHPACWLVLMGEIGAEVDDDDK